MITLDKSTITSTVKELRRINDKLYEALRIVSDSAAKQMQAYAQANAKWTDRTGNARQRLLGTAEWTKDRKVLETVICHQVDYGVWLELARKGKYAILDEALKAVAPDLLAQYQRLVR